MTQPTKRRRRSVPRPGNGGARVPGPGKALGRPSTSGEVTTLALSPVARKELSILLSNQRSVRNNQQLSQAKLVEELIHREWIRYDEDVQRHAEELADVEII